MSDTMRYIDLGTDLYQITEHYKTSVPSFEVMKALNDEAWFFVRRMEQEEEMLKEVDNV